MWARGDRQGFSCVVGSAGMVPTDYRLDHVVARLIERLEGQRPTFAGKPDEALAAFRRSTEAHLDAAIGEMNATGWTDSPERHAAFLRREVLETFLPRYTDRAVKMTEVVSGGYGMGRLADPLGRLGLFAGTALFGWLILLKLIALPIVWPLLLLTLAFPFSPDIASLLHRRRYRADLTAMVEDMTRIQEQERAYLAPEALQDADEPARPSVRNRETESP